MISVDLNCDLGESFGAYTIGMDEAVIPRALFSGEGLPKSSTSPVPG